MYTGPTIITDGLQCYFDAANPKSYPGSGVDWKDLSGNNNHGTLINGPSFISKNKGAIVFDGINDYASIPNPLGQSNLHQEWTVYSWVNVRDAADYSHLLSGLNNGLLIRASTIKAPLLYLNSGSNDYYTYGSDNKIINKGWLMVSFVFRNSDELRKIYVNTEDITTSGPNKTSTPSGVLPFLRICGSGGLNCDMSQFGVYNRALPLEEIARNYEATKTRFST